MKDQSGGDAKLNPFPPHRVGLWRVRAVPHLRKERWHGAAFGDRWRAIKAKMRVTVAP